MRRSSERRSLSSFPTATFVLFGRALEKALPSPIEDGGIGADGRTRTDPRRLGRPGHHPYTTSAYFTPSPSPIQSHPIEYQHDHRFAWLLPFHSVFIVLGINSKQYAGAEEIGMRKRTIKLWPLSDDGRSPRMILMCVRYPDSTPSALSLQAKHVAVNTVAGPTAMALSDGETGRAGASGSVQPAARGPSS